MPTVQWFHDCSLTIRIQFNISHLFAHSQMINSFDSFIWSIDGTLTGTTTLGQSGPGSNDSEGVLLIAQSSRTGAWRLDSLAFSPGHYYWCWCSRGYLLTLSYLPNPSARAGYDTRSIFKRSLTGLNSEFSFS